MRGGKVSHLNKNESNIKAEKDVFDKVFEYFVHIRTIQKDYLNLEHPTARAIDLARRNSQREGGMLPEPVRHIGLYDRWRHHRFHHVRFRHGTGGEVNILQASALVVSAVTAYKTFGPTDLTSTYYEL
ncbi:hypothetical protein TNCV_3826731 [Trichonephila clavipes]|nr:hypothetical protein TNCV_3826731 [Trichonephila clavipes]